MVSYLFFNEFCVVCQGFVFCSDRSVRGFLRDTSLRRGGNGRRNKAKRLAAVVRGRLPPPVFYKNLMQFLCECVIISQFYFQVGNLWKTL